MHVAFCGALFTAASDHHSPRCQLKVQEAVVAGIEAVSSLGAAAAMPEDRRMQLLEAVSSVPEAPAIAMPPLAPPTPPLQDPPQMAVPALCSEAPPAKASDASIASVPCALTDVSLQAQQLPLTRAGNAVEPEDQRDQDERRQDAARRIQATVRRSRASRISQGCRLSQAIRDQRRAEEIFEGRLRPRSDGTALAHDALALGADEDVVESFEVATDDSEGEDDGHSPAASVATTADTQIDMPSDELPFLPTFGADKCEDFLLHADFEAAALVFAPPSRAKVSIEEKPQASAA